eukprot:6202422-Pleurochrysis_carterae.AAC.3
MAPSPQKWLILQETTPYLANCPIANTEHPRSRSEYPKLYRAEANNPEQNPSLHPALTELRKAAIARRN